MRYLLVTITFYFSIAVHAQMVPAQVGNTKAVDFVAVQAENTDDKQADEVDGKQTDRVDTLRSDSVGSLQIDTSDNSLTESVSYKESVNTSDSETTKPLAAKSDTLIDSDDEQGAYALNKKGKLRVSLKADRTSAYVNEQILLTLRVGAPEIAFNITGDRLVVNNVDVVQLNRKQSVTEIDGIAYKSTETVFALFPREPGKLHIAPLTFNAILPMSAKAKNDDKGNPSIVASTQNLEMTIEPAPVSTSSWFPAQNVEIVSSWSGGKADLAEISAGEPVTRTVIIKVSGQHPGAIPSFEPAQQVNVRTYPDEPTMETDVDITGLKGTLTQSYVIVGSRSGSMNLPAIDIDWWHIDERRWRTTTLPSEQLQVIASHQEMAPEVFFSRRYYYALTCMVALVLALTACCVGLWRRNRRLLAQLNPRRPSRVPTEGRAWSILQRNIRKKNYSCIRHSLIQWASVCWPDREIRRLEQIPLIDSVLRKELMSLDDYLFNEKSSRIPNLHSLKKELRMVRKVKANNTDAKISLPVLYPDTV